jgi:hypothetical protein
MIIQIVLIGIVILLTAYFLRQRNTMRLRAGRKLLFVAFTLFAIITIMRPDLMSDLAHLVGVGRGADLLLYGLVLFFVFFAITVYLKFKDMEQRLAKLVRHTAISEAEIRERDKP